MTDPRRIGLIEGGAPEGAQIAKQLGPVSTDVPGGLFRGLAGLARDAEDALRRAAAETGATHVINARIAVKSSWFRAGATASGDAVVLSVGE